MFSNPSMMPSQQPQGATAQAGNITINPAVKQIAGMYKSLAMSRNQPQMMQTLAQHNPMLMQAAQQLGVSDITQLNNLNGSKGYEAFKAAAKQKGWDDARCEQAVKELMTFFEQQ